MSPALSAKINGILSDPATSQWLRDALRSAQGRDPVDVANDAEVLSQILNELAEPPDMEYTFTFVARPKGSLGRLFDHQHTVTAKTEKQAALKLYEKFEHITLTGKPKINMVRI